MRYNFDLFLYLFTQLAFHVVGQTDEGCIIGSEAFVPGQSFGDAFRTQCGEPSEWPCFCNPGLERDAECPYCSFITGEGTLYCSKDGQNITFPDGSIQRECSCQIPADPTEKPIGRCTTLPNGCNWLDLEGNDVTIENGASFGNLIDGACGSGVEWPSFCLIPPGSSGGDDYVFDYPYCVFSDTGDQEIICARDGEEVTYTDRDDFEVNCTCSVTVKGGARSSCSVGDPPRTDPTDAPVASPTDPSGGEPTGSNSQSSSSRISPLLVPVISSFLALLTLVVR